MEKPQSAMAKITPPPILVTTSYISTYYTLLTKVTFDFG